MSEKVESVFEKYWGTHSDICRVCGTGPPFHSNGCKEVHEKIAQLMKERDALLEYAKDEEVFESVAGCANCPDCEQASEIADASTLCCEHIDHDFSLLRQRRAAIALCESKKLEGGMMTSDEARETLGKWIKEDMEYEEAKFRERRPYAYLLSPSLVKIINELYRAKGWPELVAEGEKRKE